MTYQITSECIECDRCQTQCPTGAIETLNGKPFINPNLCNDCVGYYSVPQCMAVCPTNRGCVPSIDTLIQPKQIQTDYWESWFDIYDRAIAQLKARKQTKYWHRWFSLYSQEIASLANTVQ
ncbi:4Fe-4S ferredoxin [Hydrococcus rivularis NIES-593]|uniref:4Fe-4S ferredoxin n=1 Tax=Hydrococcus rivularis NIES-593 TaxID=1921803 RepID=A0A1U7HLI3_9CYAN|nr:4Fe-4S binding protein [Hydrococcus rivularis]OKH24446.1 4Fe-4S ferredoxin [Hydrococcus rivularis NIES-593]